MPEFVFAYHGGKMPESPEEGARQRERFSEWLAGLGDAVVNPGTPLGKSKTVSSAGVADGAGANAMMGFSILQAESMDAALEMARSCPFVEFGSIVVSETMKM